MRRSLLSLRRIAAACMLLAATLAAVPAEAALVTVNPGGVLNLTVSSSGVHNNLVAANGNTSVLAGSGTFLYGDAFTSSQLLVPFAGTGFGFYDDFVFTIGAGQTATVSSIIDLTGSLGIQSLQVRLYDFTANGGVVPLLTTPAVGSAFNAWSIAANLGPTGVSGTLAVLPTTVLQAGTYVLEVRGTANTPIGGAYAGKLVVSAMTPVPLPAAVPLLLSGLGLVGAFARRRRLA